jgi:hypothetical protein
LKNRKLLIAMTTAGVATAGLGASVLPAAAAARTFVVVLVDGRSLTLTVDVPAETPPEQVVFPGVTDPIATVTEVPAPAAPAPTTAPEPPATTVAPTVPAPAIPPATEGTTGTTGTTDPTGTTTGPGTTPTTPPTTGPGPTPTTPKPDARDDEPKDERGDRKGATRTRPGSPYGEAAEEDAAGHDHDHGADGGETPDQAPPRRAPDGTPTNANPSISIADLGAAPVGVPNFFIDKFRIPPFLLSIYQAAGIEYGVRWEVLAAINEIETDYGRNLNVSTAGAVGWMQFLPSTWKTYGVDANGDRRKDPYNPVDAIFAAARYLKAAGADDDLRGAIFAYNHADWYVDSVLMRARLIGGLPANLVGSLTGLTQGRFPVHARARYADDLSERDAARKAAPGTNAALPVESSAARRGIDIYARPGAPVIAVQDGRVVDMGRSERLGRYVKLRDAYGNTYTYARLGELAERHAVARPKRTSRAEVARELGLPDAGPKPTAPASAGTQRETPAAPAEDRADRGDAPRVVPEVRKERLFASPRRPASYRAGGREQLERGDDGLTTFRPYFAGRFGLDPDEAVLKDLRVGSKVIAGTILGRIGKASSSTAPHTRFEIRPAGRGAPRIDPKPILDGWKLLESSAVYRAQGRNPFFGRDADRPSIGQILLMGKEQLQRRVLENPRVEVYECGRRDIRAGKVDRRVLATLEFLAASGLKPTVTSLQCGHSFLTASGNVSHHSSGNAVDIAMVNGVPILGNQGPGSITDITNRRLLTLQGTLRPAQVISLMKYEGATNTFAMGDHHDHIHVGFQPLYGANSKLGRQVNAVLKPGQWIKLIDRLGRIDNPTVRPTPSRYAITVRPRRASERHVGE